MQIILSSQSERRKDILDMFSVPYIAQSTDIEDGLMLTSKPHINAMTSAFMKAIVIFDKQEDKDDIMVLAADTIVVIGDYQFGKPKNFEDQMNILKFLSGKTHQVITGYAIVKKDSKYVDYVTTDVTFKNLTDEMIEDYINTSEGIDRAGGYAVQGIGSILVEKILGDYHNVVGLPISSIYDAMKNRFSVNLLDL